jgi:hypothetical protein
MVGVGPRASDLGPGRAKRPGGTFENSPAFQRRGRRKERETRPVGTPEMPTWISAFQPCLRHGRSPWSHPPLKRRATITRPSGTKEKEPSGTKE